MATTVDDVLALLANAISQDDENGVSILETLPFGEDTVVWGIENWKDGPLLALEAFDHWGKISFRAEIRVTVKDISSKKEN